MRLNQVVKTKKFDKEVENLTSIPLKSTTSLETIKK